jgi:tRNA (guanosine-2'-O-)-methyltransferase
MKRFNELTRQERIDKVMSLRRSDVSLVLENLVEDQNISAILRTAEAFGIDKIYIIYQEGKKPYVSKNISSGATKWLTIEYFTDSEQCLSKVKTEGYTLIGALVDPDAEILWEQKFEGKIAIVMGTESRGLSEVAQQMIDKNIYLPMFGLTESLNVSVATALFLYEVIRQKEARE